MKAVIGLVVVAVLAGFGVNWARHHSDSLIHHGEALVHHEIDTGLPGKVEAHPWAPLSHGRPVKADAIAFDAGSVVTRRCHAVLGTYSLRIDHSFSFTRSGARPQGGCPGARLWAVLGKATRVDIESHGNSERLVVADGDKTIAQLQGRPRG